MAEYIEREYAVDAVLDVYYDTPDIDLSGEKFEAAIRKIQADDVAPVRHGRWIETPRLCYGAKQYECSLCYSDTFWNKHSIYEKYPHCPNCGAKMDLEEEQHELRRDL